MSDSNTIYSGGKLLTDYHEVHEHVLPLKVYYGVFAALLVLTGLTYAVSYMDLGPAALIVAMVVATIKAAFVVGYFMHLKYDDRFYTFVFLSTILFVGIFFVFTLGDLKARTALNDEQGTFFKIDHEDPPVPRPVVTNPVGHEGGHGEGGHH